MARIDLKKAHHLSPTRAKKLLEALALEFEGQFGAQYSWVDPGKKIYFKKSGLDGHIELLPGIVHITSNLGFLMGALKGTLESQIHVFLDDLLAKEEKAQIKEAPVKAAVVKKAAKKTLKRSSKSTGD